MSERVPAGGPYRAAAGMHERLTLEHLSEARRLLSSYCRSSRDYCCRVASILTAISPLVARARLEDLSKGDYEGLDKGIIEIFQRLIDFYARYIGGELLTYGEDVVVRVRSLVEVEGVTLYPGEYARLPPGRAAALVIAGMAEPGRATAIKIAGECSKLEGEEGQ